MKALSQDDLSVKRSELARMSREELEGLTIVALRKKATGVVSGSYRMNKADIVEAILAATKADRMLYEIAHIAPVDISEIVENQEENRHLAEYCQIVWEDFTKLIKKHWEPGEGDFNSEIGGDLIALSIRIVNYLRDYQKANGENLSPLTMMSYRTDIVNFLKECVEKERGGLRFKQYQSCLEYLQEKIKFSMADISQKKKGRQAVSVATRKESKAEIDFQPIYSFVQNTLENLETLETRDWKQVSASLAIATGRRMAEIHNSDTEFKPIDCNVLDFTGQLKIKGVAEEWFDIIPNYRIPCLVDSTLVVAGHNWLKQSDKTLTDPQKIHRRYAKDLSEFMYKLRIKWDIDHNLFSYKGLRSTYAYVCNQVFNDASNDQNLYYALILGHGRRDIPLYGRIIDTDTPESYKSDFTVVNLEIKKLGVSPNEKYFRDLISNDLERYNDLKRV